MRLIYFSPVPWQSFTQRPHEFVRWFHAKYNREILWVNPYPTRLPKLEDWRRPHKVGKQTSTPRWLQVLQPRALPIEPLPSGASINYHLFWSELLDSIHCFAKAESTAVAVGKPSALALLALKSLQPAWSLYDAMDNFPAFYSGISANAMAKLECKLIGHVHSIWTSSSHTFERIQTLGAHPTLVKNACSSQLISGLKRNMPETFTIGYVGTIGEWFDWERVLSLAETNAEISVQIVGPIFNSPQKTLPSNISIKPPLPHEAALKLFEQFSAGFIPFKENSLTAAVDPVKYYEFHAAGLPVISSRFGEMRSRNHRDGVYFFEDYPDSSHLITQCQRFFQSNDSIEEFLRFNDWSYRFDTAMNHDLPIKYSTLDGAKDAF